MPDAVRPYSPSWVDRLMAGVDRLPFPAWLFYLGLLIVGSVAMQAALWIDGVVPVGQLDSAWLANTVWVALPLAWMHYLVRLASSALDRFAPVVSDRPDEFAAARYRMLTMPARPVLVMTAIVAGLLILGIVGDPAFVYEGLEHPASYALVTPVMGLAFGLLPVLFYFTVRMLRSVGTTYDLVGRIPLQHQRPLFSLANLTMQSALLWVLVVNLNLASFLLLEGDSTPSGQAITFTFSAVGIVAAFVLFLFPLRGIHRRLEDAKTELIEENAR